MQPKAKLLAALLLIICAMVLLIHWPALTAGSLSFDDNQYLTENPLVQNPGWTSASRFLSEILEPSTVKGYYQPLTMISLMLDYALGGRVDNLLPFHRTSLILHMANTALVITLLYLLFGNVWVAAAVGLLFGAHPMTTETVSWVGERKTLLAAFFSLWCLVLYVRFAQNGNWKFLIGCILMYILALMSKPTSVPLPVLMLLLDFWPLKRLNLQAVIEKLPLFVVGAFFAVIIYVSQSRTSGVALPDEYGPERIPLVLCHNIIFYLNKIVWPTNLSSYYMYPQPLALSHPAVQAGLIGTCILILLLIISLRWTRAVLTGWLFFFVAIFPTMGVVGFTKVIAADKYVYLPSIGLLLVLTSLLCWFCSINKTIAKKGVVAIIVLLLAGSEAVATRRYLVHWRDSVTLYEYMLTLTPDAAPVHNNLGNVLESQGRLDEAISHYRQALQIKPDNAEAHYNLAIALKDQQNLKDAISHYRQALQIKPDYPSAHNNLGLALEKQGKLDEAISHYRQAIRLKPNYAPGHYNLAAALVKLGKLDEAITNYNKVLQIKPDHAPSHYQLALTFAIKSQIDDTVKHLRQAIDIKPDYLAALNTLAKILAANPDEKFHDPDQAVKLAMRAAELTDYKDPSVLNTLAEVYAAAGQFDKAVKTTQTAIDLAAAAKNSDLENHFRKKLQLYKNAQP